MTRRRSRGGDGDRRWAHDHWGVVCDDGGGDVGRVFVVWTDDGGSGRGHDRRINGVLGIKESERARTGKSKG